LLFEIDGKVKV